METSDKLKEIDIRNRTCHYFDYIIKIEDFDLDNVLIDEKSYKNILVYNILYKIFIAAKPLHFRSDKTNEFIKLYDETRYLVLYGSEKAITGLDIL